MNIIQIVLVFVCVYVFIEMAVFICNISLFKNKKDYTSKNKLLVVVAHQDDEIVVAGGAILKTLNKGGSVKIIFTVDGINRDDRENISEIKNKIKIRENESVQALKYLGVKKNNIIFLRNENEKSLQVPKIVKKNIERIYRIINNYKPDIIITCAFEGGHCDHDITNYMVVKASERINFDKRNLFETTEYNRFYLAESIKSRLNKFLIVKFKIPSKFIPGKNEIFTLDMSKFELEKKINSLKYFKTQNSKSLMRRFGFPEQIRIIENYTYKNGPFNPNNIIRYRLCFFLRRREQKCSSFFCGLSYSDYLKIYKSLDGLIK